jgi:hypothetical protein
MSTMSVPESRARLGYLLSEMLSLPHLPEDLHQAVTAHLQQQLAFVNLLKPEYCLRLYPVLAELAELEAKSAEAPAEIEMIFSETSVEETEPETPAETTAVETADETPVESLLEESAPEAPAENVSVEAAAESAESPEDLAETMPMAAIAEIAGTGNNPRTLW